jgi:murein DD-endopeptidase MepM/ murein hydrolase activator NlpD
MVKEKESFWQKMRRQYRLAILDDRTLREIFHMRLSGLGTFSTLMVLFLLLIILLSALIVLTPIRNILPGYSESIRQQLISENARVDSLQNSLTLQRQYLDVIKQLTAGDIQSDSIIRLDSLQKVENVKLPDMSNEETDAFLLQYEQQERDRLLLFGGPAQRTMQQMYAPARGVVMRSARFDLKQYGIAIRVARNENVLAVLRGTIVLLQPNLNNTYTIVIQHDRYVSVYRNVGTALKTQGVAVEEGESIGLMAGDNELEFELWESGKPVDPEKVVVF